MNHSVSLALNNLKRRRVRSALTLLGIVIGIAAIISLISLGQALQGAITGQFSTLSADKLTIQNSGTGFGPPGSTVVNKLTSYDQKLIERVDHVDEVVPRLIRIGAVEYNKVKTFEYLVNILEDEKKNKIIYDSFGVTVERGRLLNANDRGKVLLGNDFTSLEKFDKQVRVGSQISIQGKSFEVVGILERASSFQVNSVIFMTDEDLKEILKLDDEIDLLVVQVDNEKNVELTSEKIRDTLRKDRNLELGEEDFAVETPLQALASVNNILNVINIIIVSIAAISLIIGSVGVMNTMYTSVLERTKEIGTMKAIGAKNKDILAIFLVESALLGLIGGILGMLLGISLAWLMIFLARQFIGSLDFNLSISWPLMTAVIGFSTVLGVLSGILPALQASKLKPVEALRA